MPDDTGLPSSSASSATSGGIGAFVALKSGLVIRQYVIEEVIGAGGFGITYRARHQRLASKVFALKEFFPRQFAARHDTHVVSTPDGGGLFRWGLDRFLKEAEALAKCEHPGIVDVVDYFEENGTAYAVLGYVEGQQLGQWLDSLGRPPTQAELDRILMPLLDALETVHGAGLLHRDIAPDNILVRRDGSPCLIDFGACREDIRDRSRKISAIVKHGYSPPEQYHGIADLQGPWTDIYSVAATAYRAISGGAPMDSSLRGSLGDELRPVSQMTGEDYRPAFLAAIDAGLILKPNQRPQSVAEWRTMLSRETLAGAPVASVPGRPPEGDSRREPSRTDAGSSDVATPGLSAGARSPTSTEASRPSQPVVTGSARRGPMLAALAALALIAAGGAAWWRGAEPSADSPAVSAPPTAPSSQKTIDVAVPASESGAPAPTAVDRDALADAAWRNLANRTDIAAIERFLAEHGASPIATTARARLAGLRDDARRADETARADGAKASQAAAEAQARANRQQVLDRNWQACREAPDASKGTACAAVIQSDDTAARRAAALHSVGMVARNTGDHDKAIADFTRSLSLVADDAQVLNDRGIAHFLKGGAGDREAAMQDYRNAIRIDARHAEALNNHAWGLFQAGRTGEALADANRSIEAQPANGYAYDTRGQILEALGRRDDAIRDFERALSLDPSQETSRAALARLRAAGR